MGSDLKARYIYAVVRHLPDWQKEEVRESLVQRIDEKMRTHQGNGVDMEDVLEALGNPEEVALEYCENTPRSGLISGVYFLLWRRVLVLVLPIVASVAAVAAIVGMVMGQGFSLSIFFFSLDFAIAARGLHFGVVVVGAVLQAFVIITLVFIVLDYKKVPLQSVDFIQDLPELPECAKPVSVSASAVEIVVSISLTALFIGYPELMGLRSEGVWIPIFDVDLLRALWLPFVIWCALEVGFEILKLAEGRYTPRLAVLSVLAGIGCAICAFAVFGQGSLANPDFIYYIEGLTGEIPVLEGTTGNIITNPQRVALVIMLAVIFFETLDVVVKAFQAKR